MSEITKHKALNSLEAELTHYQQNIDTQFTTIIQYSDIFFRNSRINQNMLKSSNDFNNYLLKQELRTMTGGNTFIETTFFYNKFTRRFISIDSNYSENEFNSNNGVFGYANWLKEDMYNKLDKTSEIYIHPYDTIVSKYENSYQGITILVPVPYPNQSPYGVLMTIISTDQLFSYLQGSSSVNNILLLATNTGEIIASSGQTEYMASDEFLILLQNFNADFDTISLLGEEYIVYQKESSLGLLKFLYIAPLKDVLSEVNTAVTSIFLSIAILFFTGTFLIGWFMYINYTPIHKMKERLLSSNVKLTQRDDFRLISEAINELKKQNENLFEKVILNKNITQEYFFIRLINGNFENEEVIRQQAKDCDISLKEYVCCVAFGSLNRNIIKVLDSINHMLSIYNESTSIYLIKGLQHEDFTVILSFSDEAEIKPFVYELYNLEKDICIGIGSIEKLVQANKSYTFSLAALEYGMNRQEFPVTCYNDLQYEDYHDMQATVNKLKDMELAIKQGNATGLHNTVLLITELLENEEIRNALKKTIYISAHNILTKGLQEYGIDREYIYVLPQRELDLEEAKDNIFYMQQKISEFFEAKNRNKTVTPEMILSYIHENLYNANLSLASVGEKFSMSYSNFSHFFKKNVGVTFIQYLEQLRIEECKKLLMNSNLTVEELAQKVGYNSANSLTRAFKKATGYSPNKYKNTHKRSR
jgi:AraC-like DNA-binding protein